MRPEERPPARRARRRRLIGAAGTIGIHSLILAVVLASSLQSPPRTWPEAPIEVELAEGPPSPAPLAAKPSPTPAPSAPAAPKRPSPPKPVKPKVKPPPPQRLTKAPRPSEVPPRVVPPEPAAPPLTEPSVSTAELASALTAEGEAAGEGGLGSGEGEGGGGGGSGSGAGGRCNMVGRLQRALGNDARVRTALAQTRRAPGFLGRPLVVWNGDWVRHGEEEGKGLASVRQAIAVEVAFAPKACRAQPMRGLVRLSVNGSMTPVVLGAGSWRWSDLLYTR